MATIARAQFTIADLTDIISQPTEPASPVAGMIWQNSATNVLSVYHASPPVGWQVVADATNLQGLINGLSDGTVGNDTFNAIMDAATALVGPVLPDGSVGPGGLASAPMMDLINNVAASLKFGADGLTISNKGGEYATKLAPQQLEFWKGKDAAAVCIAIFGLLQTITSSTLQIGYSNQSPKLVLGAGVLEYQAATGNITCRKA
jgi:hypothetical protein